MVKPKKRNTKRNANVSNNGNAPKPRKRQQRRRAIQRPMQMSEAGRNFLKCAFAPPDFNTDPGQGIPDAFEGKTLVRKDVTTSSINATDNMDSFYLIAPTPGVSYWTVEVAAGTLPLTSSTWTPVYVPGFETLFGKTGQSDTNKRANQVSMFRYASLAVGLYPTSNLMQFAGSITSWKIPLRMQMATYIANIATSPVVNIAQTGWIVNGLDGTSKVSPDNYAGTFIEGLFSQSIANEPDFEFQPVLEGIYECPILGTSGGNPGDQFGNLNGDVLGCGMMDSLVIRVSSPKSAVNNFILKTWSCIEYRVNPNSALYQSAKDSPALDMVALAAYRKVALSIPVAVPYHKNAEFWNRVRQILMSALDTARYLPGPIGELATGIQATTKALQTLWI